MLAITERAPLSREALAAELFAAVAPYRFEETRLHALLASRPVPPRLLARFAVGTYAMASQFLPALAALAEAAPDPASRLSLLENLLEEEGIVFKPSRGLAVRPEQRHVNLARRFVAACGVDPDTIDVASHPAPALTRARRMVADGRWTEAVAYLLIGNELKAGEACARIVELLLAAGLAERDIAFYQVHIEADMSHGREALDMVCRAATDRETQGAAILAASEGARAWFESYGGNSG